jgi:septum formation protein
MTILSLWLHAHPLILASASKTRADILRSANFYPELHPANINERALEDEFIKTNTNPADTARELAKAKAINISALHPNHYVIGADQTLSLGDMRFHKPANINEARKTLQQFSGNTHQLHSGLALAHNGKLVWSHVETAHMHVRELSEDFINSYLAQAGESVLSSVGAYQYEGLGIHLFESIVGDQSTILGLPLLPLLAELRKQRLVL